MKAFGAVVKRELEELWLLWPAALLLGGLSLISAFVASGMGFDAVTARDATAMASALMLGFGLLVSLGRNVLAADLASGRLAFYLSRPISPAALWLGRLTAAVLTFGLAMLAVLLPSLLLGSKPLASLEILFGSVPKVVASQVPRPWSWNELPGQLLPVAPESSLYFELPFPLLIALAGLFVFFLSHHLSLASPRHGRWTLLDLTAGLVVGAWLLAAATRLASLQASKPMVGAAAALVAVCGGVLVLGGWAQLRWAGGDRRRSHAIFSCLLWSGVLLVLAGLEGAIAGVLGRDPRQLDRLIDVLPAPEGPWVVATGLDRATGMAMTFVTNVESGTVVPLVPRSALEGPPLFSGDGRRLLWQDRRLAWPSWLDVGGLPPRVEVTPGLLPLDTNHGALALDRTGEQLATTATNLVRIHELETGRELWKQRIEAPSGKPTIFSHLSFDGPSTAVALLHRSVDPPRSRSHRAELWRFEPGDQGASQTHTFPSAWTFFQPLGDGRFLARDDARRPVVLDSEGKVLHPPAAGPAPWTALSRLLAGDRLLRVTRRDGAVDWNLYAPETVPLDSAEAKQGSPISSGSFPRWFYPAGEPEPGVLLLGMAPSMNPLVGRRWPGSWQTWVLDVDSGEIRLKVEDSAPLPLPRGPGEMGADWLLDTAGFPHRLDLASGRLEPVMGVSR